MGMRCMHRVSSRREAGMSDWASYLLRFKAVEVPYTEPLGFTNCIAKAETPRRTQLCDEGQLSTLVLVESV